MPSSLLQSPVIDLLPKRLINLCSVLLRGWAVKGPPPVLPASILSALALAFVLDFHRPIAYNDKTWFSKLHHVREIFKFTNCHFATDRLPSPIEFKWVAKSSHNFLCYSRSPSDELNFFFNNAGYGSKYSKITLHCSTVVFGSLSLSDI